MTTQSFYTRQMLMHYGRQLVAARRLARREQLIGRGPHGDAPDAEARRRAIIERIAHEIMDNLIFSGSENSIVGEVRRRLAGELGEHLVFRFPPAEGDVRIFRKSENGEEKELPQGEKQLVMDRLWDVTLKTVDATML
jgi:hypothetical protein